MDDGNKTPTQDSMQRNETGVIEVQDDESTTPKQASRQKNDTGVHDVEDDGSTTPTRKLTKGQWVRR